MSSTFAKLVSVAVTAVLLYTYSLVNGFLMALAPSIIPPFALWFLYGLLAVMLSVIWQATFLLTVLKVKEFSFSFREGMSLSEYASLFFLGAVGLGTLCYIYLEMNRKATRRESSHQKTKTMPLPERNDFGFPHLS